MCHCIFFGINPRVSKHHAFRHHRATPPTFKISLHISSNYIHGGYENRVNKPVKVTNVSACYSESVTSIGTLRFRRHMERTETTRPFCTQTTEPPHREISHDTLSIWRLQYRLMAHSHCTGLGQGQGPENDGFLYYAMYCTHCTGTGTAIRNHCFLLYPSRSLSLSRSCAVCMSH